MIEAIIYNIEDPYYNFPNIIIIAPQPKKK